MNPRLPALLLVLATVSCDKVKTLAAKAGTAVKDQIEAKTAPAVKAVPVDPELQKLVDQTAEGVVFRKDLPFPAELEVRTTRREELSGRFSQSSDLGQGAAAMKGTALHVTLLKLTGNLLRYEVEKSSFTLPAAAGPAAKSGKAAEPVEKVDPAVAPAIFRKTGKLWQAQDRSDFRTVAMIQEIAPVFSELLAESALAPRPLWFANHRFKIGEELEVAGNSLPMLLGGKTKGSLKLKLVALEPVVGHPCGVFAFTGDYSQKQAPSFDGGATSAEVTIQSGKLWLSLLYPVILQQEMDTIQSTQSGGKGGLTLRGQGSVKVTLTREWKRLGP